MRKAAALLLAAFLSAHYFWVSPQKQDHKWKLFLLTGDRFPESTYAIKETRIEEIRIFPEGKILKGSFVRGKRFSWLLADVPTLPAVIMVKLHERTLSYDRTFLERYLKEEGWEELLSSLPEKKSYREKYRKLALAVIGKPEEIPASQLGPAVLLPQWSGGRLFIKLLIENAPAEGRLIRGSCGKLKFSARTDRKGRIEVPALCKGLIEATSVIIKRASGEEDLESLWLSILLKER